MSGEQAKLTLTAVLTYDAEGMHSGDKDPEARDWFMFDVLYGGGLVLHDNKEIGDAIGTLSQVEFVAHDDDDAAELMRENAKLRAGVTLIAIELDKMKLTDISEALRKVLAAASEGQP